MHFKFNFWFLIFQVNPGIQTFVSGTEILLECFLGLSTSHASYFNYSDLSFYMVPPALRVILSFFLKYFDSSIIDQTLANLELNQ